MRPLTRVPNQRTSGSTIANGLSSRARWRLRPRVPSRLTGRAGAAATPDAKIVAATAAPMMNEVRRTLSLTISFPSHVHGEDLPTENDGDDPEDDRGGEDRHSRRRCRERLEVLRLRAVEEDHERHRSER